MREAYFRGRKKNTMQHSRCSALIICTLFCFQHALQAQPARVREDFDNNWTFHLGDVAHAKDIDFDDASWRKLNLPHDWSIELPFDSTSPTNNSGGALRGGGRHVRSSFAYTNRINVSTDSHVADSAKATA